MKTRPSYSIIARNKRLVGRWNMLEKMIELTNEYIESMPKKERKKYGQFFTSMETARFMAALYNIDEKKSRVSVLDAGAGSGILSCAFIERLEMIDSIQEIELTCYENDNNVLPLLKQNLEYCKEKSGKKIDINIIEDNYILSQYLDFNHMIGGNDDPKKYDFVIGNPPYMKISKDAPEATAMPKVCYGAPNLYFIFASMGLFNLCENGEMVYIIPRSWTSGAYFKRFREYFLTVGKLEHIHLFVSRSKVFDKESVLQETIIIKVRKTDKMPETVTITSSKSNSDFGEITSQINNSCYPASILFVLSPHIHVLSVSGTLPFPVLYAENKIKGLLLPPPYHVKFHDYESPPLIQFSFLHQLLVAFYQICEVFSKLLLRFHLSQGKHNNPLQLQPNHTEQSMK